MEGGNQMKVRAARLMGRCADGAERDSGRLVHALEIGSSKALCGAKAGRRSAGWSSWHVTEVTCRQCARGVRLRQAEIVPVEHLATLAGINQPN